MRLGNPLLWAACFLVCALAAGCGVVGSAASPPPATATATGSGDAKNVVLSTATDHYLGVIDNQMPKSYAQAQAFSKATGAKINIVAYYSGWTESLQSTFLETAWKHGAVTMVDMDPYSRQSAMQEIADGKYDWYLYQFAHAIVTFGHPVIINFAHEMNGSWFHYGYKYVKPATFIAAFRHIHTIFEMAGASNVTWLWTVNVPSGTQTGPIAQFYPGDAYVDWIGIDGYDWQGDRTFDQTFGSTIEQVKAITKKPILISETSVVHGPNSAMQVASWLQGIKANHLLGFVWYNVDKSGYKNTGDTHDWELQDNPAELAAFRSALSAYVG